jgi:hypothetical protein
MNAQGVSSAAATPPRNGTSHAQQQLAGSMAGLGLHPASAVDHNLQARPLQQQQQQQQQQQPPQQQAPLTPGPKQHAHAGAHPLLMPTAATAPPSAGGAGQQQQPQQQQQHAQQSPQRAGPPSLQEGLGTEAHEDGTMSERVAVSKHLVGKLIGKAGATIQQLQVVTQTSIQIDQVGRQRVCRAMACRGAAHAAAGAAVAWWAREQAARQSSPQVHCAALLLCGPVQRTAVRAAACARVGAVQQGCVVRAHGCRAARAQAARQCIAEAPSSQQHARCSMHVS